MSRHEITMIHFVLTNEKRRQKQKQVKKNPLTTKMSLLYWSKLPLSSCTNNV